MLRTLTEVQMAPKPWLPRRLFSLMLGKFISISELSGYMADEAIALIFMDTRPISLVHSSLHSWTNRSQKRTYRRI